MDKRHFLADFVTGEPGFTPEPWYNPHGDCLVYKAENVATVAERVDNILTIYESAVDGSTIGFKIKGVKHLLEKMGCHAMAVVARTGESGQIEEISLSMILLAAYESGPADNVRRARYAKIADQYAGRIRIPQMALSGN
jgi:hypothetical protein